MEPALNDAGQIAFFTGLGGTGVNDSNRMGLWSGTPGNLALVAREGEHAPGTPDGVVFNEFYHPNIGLGQFSLNAAGQTAFGARLTGSGISFSNDFGIWATDRNGILQLIAREGDLLEISPGDFRTINQLRFADCTYTYSTTGNSDGKASAFNNRGQLAFKASFVGGGSGIFVSNRVAIPEPSTFLLAAIPLIGLGLFRHRSLNRGSRQKRLRRNSQASVQSADHGERQRTFTAQHLGDSGPASDVGLQIAARQSPLLHGKANCLDGIGRIDWIVLLFPSCGQCHDHIQPVALRRIGLRVHQLIDFLQCPLIVALAFDWLDDHIRFPLHESDRIAGAFPRTECRSLDTRNSLVPPTDTCCPLC